LQKIGGNEIGVIFEEGKIMSTKICEFCGALLMEGETVCSACGHINADAGTFNAPYQQPNPQYRQPMPMPPYQQPGYFYPQVAYMPQQDTTPMTIGDYAIMIILSAIPLAGLILLLIWAFDSNVNINKRNYARANLIIGLVAFGLFLIVFILAAIFGSSHSYSHSYY
jgi:hypothetical protein